MLLSCALLLLRAFVCALLLAQFCPARFCLVTVRYLLRVKENAVFRLNGIVDDGGDDGASPENSRGGYVSILMDNELIHLMSDEPPKIQNNATWDVDLG